ITTLKDKKYVEIPKGIDSVKKVEIKSEENAISSEITSDEDEIKHTEEIKNEFDDIRNIQRSAEELGRLKRVFITHGKNRDFIDPIKKLLKFGELEAVVSVERTSVSVPV